ncbi:D-alanyl-D-alanine carboxypeptidase family protein [Streptomyces chattanoogensis]|uniref:D-alanyl-D-alanine carboxypeptidase family protein n=1 Tax=Streptomyces chattanoogensis TaxID=66876 RepID=UPI00369EA2E9
MSTSMGGGSIRRSGGALFRGVMSGAGDGPGTFCDVPTIFADPTASVPSTTPGSTAARRRPARAAAVLATATLLASPLLAGTAYAVPQDGKEPKAPAPPAKMSRTGGDRLGLPGVQVGRLAPGAPELPGPDALTARSWIISDAASGQVLAAKNPHWRLAPASTLKMLFADTVLPKFPKDEKRKVRAADLEGMGVGSSLVGIKENLTYSVHDLWLGVFLRSGNDAVHALSAMNGGTAATVAEMQKRAKELNATDTHVVTPDGYDAPGQVSSAYDLTLFARAGLKNADFREYCSTASAQFPGEAAKNGKRKTFGIQNTNRLLSGDYDIKPYPGIAGVKNGSTTNAGSTFTGVAVRGGRTLLVTVMNPQKKEHNEAYREAARLLDWGFQAAGKVEPVGRLVGPKSQEDRAEHAKARGDAAGKNGQGGQAAGSADDSSGVLTGVGIAGGVLLLLGLGAMVLRRRRGRS